MGLAICGRKTVKRLPWLILTDASWCQLMPADLICLQHVLFNLFPNAHSVLAMPCDILCWIETSSRCNRRSSCCNANLARLFRSWKNSKQGYSNNGCLLFQLLTRIDLQHWASDRLRSSEIEEGLEIFARHRFRTGNAAQVCVFWCILQTVCILPAFSCIDSTREPDSKESITSNIFGASLSESEWAFNGKGCLLPMGFAGHFTYCQEATICPLQPLRKLRSNFQVEVVQASGWGFRGWFLWLCTQTTRKTFQTTHQESLK